LYPLAASLAQYIPLAFFFIAQVAVITFAPGRIDATHSNTL
jgi:hypothetical protein